MKALTLTAPYGTLVAIAAHRPDLGKHIETRSWATSYRGPLAIHQARGLGPIDGKSGYLEFCTANELVYRALNEAGLVPFTWNAEALMALPRGAIVATCELHDCVPMTAAIRIGWWRAYAGGKQWTLTEQEYDFGLYAPGRYAWLLSNIQALAEPIPARGYQRLWEPDTLTQLAITRQQIQAVGR